MNRLTSTLAILTMMATAVYAQVPDWRYYRPGNTGIPGDYVQAIHVDANDRPYIAAYIPFWAEGGFSRFDAASNSWTCFSNVDLAALVSERVNDIEEAPGGVLWIGTNNGIIRFDPAIGPASMTRLDASNAPLPNGNVQDLTVDPDGNLWVAIGPPGGQGCLARYQPASGAWNVWTTANGLPWGSMFPGWNALARVAAVPDPDGNFTVYFIGGPGFVSWWKNGVFGWNTTPGWAPPEGVQLTGQGFRPLDPQGNMWFRVSYPSGPSTFSGFGRRAPDGSWTIIGNPPGEGLAIQGVRALRNGRLIVGTSGGTVHLWDNGWTALGLWNDINHTYAFGEESNGAIWVGGIGGSARWNGSSWQRHRISSDSMMGYHIATIDFAPDGRVFMNGNAAPNAGGFNIFDSVRWTCVDNLNYGLGPLWGQPTDEVSALRFRANGRLAIAPAGAGLFEWDGATYTPFEIEPNDWFNHITEDGAGNLWAVSERLGVYRFTNDEMAGERFDFTNSPISSGWGDKYSITPDPTSPTHVWIAQTDAALRTNGITWQTISGTSLGLPDDEIAGTILCATPAADGAVWIGSMSGLFRVVPQTGAFTHYTKTNSALPSDEVRHIHFAPDGSMWIASWDSSAPLNGGGITHVRSGTWTTYSYGTSLMPHNQVNVLNSRAVVGGYELWVGFASPGVAVLTFETSTLPGDVNGDSSVDTSDILPFIEVLLGMDVDPQHIALSNVNGDGATDGRDVNGFVFLLLQD